MLSVMAPSNDPLQLYLDSESDPISGALIHADGRRQRFSGWIELTAVLEEARRSEHPEVLAHSRTDPADEPSGQSEDPPQQ
jgi:hypothetical protein